MAITLGNEYIFASGATEIPVVRALDADRFVVAWRDGADSDNGKMCVGTRSGTDITYGSIETFCSGTIQAEPEEDHARTTLDVVCLTSSGFVVGYVKNADHRAYARGCTVSDDTITMGSESANPSHTSKTDSLALCKFTDDKICFAYDYENTWNGQLVYAICMEVAGTTVTWNTSYGSLQWDVTHLRAITLDEDTVYLTWGRQRVAATKYVQGAVLSRSGTILSFVAVNSLDLESAGAWEPKECEPAVLSSGATFDIIEHYRFSSKGRGIYVNASGTTLTKTSPVEFLGNDLLIGGTLVKDSDNYWVSYRDNGDGNYGKLARGTVIDGTPTYSDAETWHEASTYDHHVTLLEYPFAVVAYRDSANSSYGTARIIQLPVDAQVSLYIQGPIQSSGTSTLYIANTGEISASGDLFIEGLSSTPWSASGDLFVEGHQNTVASGDLFTVGWDNIQASGDLFIEGLSSTPWSASGDLFVHGLETTQASGDMFVGGYTLGSGDTPLHIYGIDSASGDISLCVGGTTTTSGNLDLYLGGHESTYNSGILYINGSGIILESGTIPLIVNGTRPREAASCPTLDPTASIQITDELISVYQSRIDAVINQLGKSVLLEFKPIETACTNCKFDVLRKRSTGIYLPGGPRPFARGRQCPYCKGRGFLETASQKCIRCLIRWNSKDAADYGISVTRGQNVVRFKTYLYNYDDLIRAEYAISNYDSQTVAKLKVRRIKSPIITGLREDRYCISFWESV